MAAKKVVRSNSRLNRARKLLYRWTGRANALPVSTLFILGCQRSGTTIVSRVFDALPWARVYGEYNDLVHSRDSANALQIADIAGLSRALAADPLPLRVLKPLADSQNANELLAAVPDSRIVWVVREPLAVARSNIRKFGGWTGETSQLLPIVAADATDWRGQGVSARTRETIEYLNTRQKLSALESACLFWYARNVLFFEQGLHENDRVRVWHYEDFVARSGPMVDRLLLDIGNPSAPAYAIAPVGRSAEVVSPMSDETVTDEVMKLCQGLYDRFTSLRMTKGEVKPFRGSTGEGDRRPRAKAIDL